MARGIRTGLRHVAGTVDTWRERRRCRLALAGLNRRLLDDLGLTPGDAEMEFSKPFWRA